MTEQYFGGVYSRPDGTYSVTPRMPLGKLSADDLEKIMTVVRKYNLPGIRATAGQRITIEGVPADSLDDIIGLLNGVGDRCPHGIVACRGLGECKHGLQDSQAMATQVEDLFCNSPRVPAHMKVGLSGCTRCCGNSYIRDIGFVGTTDGWTLTIGGRSGRKVRSGDELLTGLSASQALAAMEAFQTFFTKNMRAKERIAAFVERIGLDRIKAELQTPDAPE